MHDPVNKEEAERGAGQTLRSDWRKQRRTTNFTLCGGGKKAEMGTRWFNMFDSMNTAG